MTDLTQVEVGKRYRFTLQVEGVLGGFSVSYDELRTVDGKRIPLIGNEEWGVIELFDIYGERHSIPAQVIVAVEEA